MQDVLSLAAQNLLSPIVLFFVLGVGAALARSDLTIPEAVAKGISLYLLFAIGFKGGVAVSNNGIDLTLGMTLMSGVILSFVLPFIAFGLLRWISQLSRTDAAAVAGHYGSISIVTFVAATSVLQSSGIVAEGYMVAVAAAMEAPAIFSALLLVSSGGKGRMDGALIREILLNGSIVLLVGSFLIGWITGAEGMAKIEALIVAPSRGSCACSCLIWGWLPGVVLNRGVRFCVRGRLFSGC